MTRTTCLRSVVALALGLLAAGWLAGPAAAQGKKGKNKGRDATIIHELRETNVLLHKADHDYKGHRVAAMRQIRQAVHQLQHHKAHPKGGNVAAGKGTGKGGQPLPQSVSDEHLRHAIKRLRNIARQIEQIGASAQQPHHHAALRHVRHAIQDLEKALKVA